MLPSGRRDRWTSSTSGNPLSKQVDPGLRHAVRLLTRLTPHTPRATDGRWVVSALTRRPHRPARRSSRFGGDRAFAQRRSRRVHLRPLCWVTSSRTPEWSHGQRLLMMTVMTAHRFGGRGRAGLPSRSGTAHRAACAVWPHLAYRYTEPLRTDGP
jgi:hypothetical protein